jgi:hypothetical protein
VNSPSRHASIDFKTSAPTEVYILPCGRSSAHWGASHRNDWPFAGLAETKGLVDVQYAIVTRLKRIGANSKQAICLLMDLLELQQMREQRLAYLRMRPENRRR